MDRAKCLWGLLVFPHFAVLVLNSVPRKYRSSARGNQGREKSFEHILSWWCAVSECVCQAYVAASLIYRCRANWRVLILNRKLSPPLVTWTWGITLWSCWAEHGLGWQRRCSQLLPFLFALFCSPTFCLIYFPSVFFLFSPLLVFPLISCLLCSSLILFFLIFYPFLDLYYVPLHLFFTPLPPPFLPSSSLFSVFLFFGLL